MVPLLGIGWLAWSGKSRQAVYFFADVQRLLSNHPIAKMCVYRGLKAGQRKLEYYKELLQNVYCGCIPLQRSWVTHRLWPGV